MSVYLDRSPYYNSNYRNRKVSRSRVAGRKNMSSNRSKRGGLFSLFAKNTNKAMTHSIQKTGNAVQSGAKVFSEVAGAVKNIKDRKVKWEIGPSVIIGALGSVAILLSLAYLAHFNQVATKGYELKRLEADRQQLLSQYEIKNMKLAQVKALNTIAKSDKANAMRRPYNTEFIRGNTVLASR